jgi:serine/threonine-protein kinase
MKKVIRLSLVLVLLAILGSAGAVFYLVFFGGESVVVPPMVGASVLDAVDMVERMGLQVRVDQEESLEPRGTVVAQWPQSGVKVNSEKIIILKVSKGGYKKALPDLRGMEFSRATAKLQELEFLLGDVIRVVNDKPSGVVVAQNPAAPVMISRTRPVALLVSMGPEKNSSGRIVVPDVLGKDEESARKLVAQSGLSVSVEYVYTQSSPPGMAISLRPKAGTSLPSGGNVTVKVSTMRQSAKPPRPAENDSPTVSTSPAEITVPGSTTQPGTQTTVSTQPSKPSSGGARIVVVPGEDASGPRPAPAPDEGQSQQEPAQQRPETPPVTSEPGKTAKIRYQVPPLTKPLQLKIEIIDKKGARTLVEKEVSGGEYVSLDGNYVGEAAVTIYLGGEFVWQDRYR